MHVVCIIQARTGSTRLPGKVLKKICGKTILEHDIHRVKKAKTIDKIVIATTTLAEDEAIVQIATEQEVDAYRGSVDDLLSRYYYAAKQSNADIVVRITSDNPVIDPQIIDTMVNEFINRNKNEKIDYLSNFIKMSFPKGLDVEVFTYEALSRCFVEAKKDYEREHVTPYIYLNPEKFTFTNVENDVDYSHYRWCVDTQEDFELVSTIYDHLYKENGFFYFEDILAFIKAHPEVAKLNEHVKQKKLGE